MTTDAVGGVWPYVLDLAGALAPLGVDTTLAVMGPPPAPDQEAEALAVPGLRVLRTALPLDWLAEDAGSIRAAGEALAGLAADAGAEVVHLNSPANAAGVRWPVPVVGVAHSCVATWWDAVKEGPLPEDFRWRAALTAEGYRAVDRLVVPSDAFGADTARVYALPRRPVAVHNGRRLLPVRAPADGAPARFALTAGRLWDEGKGMAALDTAAALCRVPVLAAGAAEGPNGTRAVLPHLQLLGRMPEAVLGGWMTAASVFVSTALYEPFGFAVLEAVRAGCAPVLSDIASFREIWGDAAVFVPPGDAAAIAAAVDALCADEARREAVVAAARERAGRYTAERMAAAMLEVYREVAR
ncbi:glycosyltransferase family 4 protein [Roseomonas elaeocarpi]|uniref:Glycosyltransferase family 4 protein n=1 Tax=Roseomonas elaeocarpi TaxID=907779 RepID=A0ABV6JY01_9PROT